ncbi:MAG: hypothetical protein KFB93_07055 [Simkaniaceae bacterium]|nr:MAG: hypothetical protein KFB93_07055 [Simkaniaceae bacterium]
MASATLVPPMLTGGVLGHYWHRFLDSQSSTYDGALFGALWATTTVIISHRSCHLQDGIDEDRIWVIRTLSISSFVLALISGFILNTFLIEKGGLSIPVQMSERMAAAAILGSKKLIPFFSPYRLW